MVNYFDGCGGIRAAIRVGHGIYDIPAGARGRFRKLKPIAACSRGHAKYSGASLTETDAEPP